MNRIKKNCIKKVVRFTELSCTRSSREIKPVEHLLHMTHEDLFVKIEKIINALPDYYFYDLNSVLKEDLMDFISRHYVFFETSREYTNENYNNDLELFIISLSDRIRVRYF